MITYRLRSDGRIRQRQTAVASAVAHQLHAAISASMIFCIRAAILKNGFRRAVE